MKNIEPVIPGWRCHCIGMALHGVLGMTHISHAYLLQIFNFIPNWSMILSLRKKYNEEFTEENYHRFLEELGGVFPGHLDFRVAETPVFCSPIIQG